MKAVLVDEFQKLPRVTRVPDPELPTDGIIIRVEASGLCRSDWHGWMGHDDDIRLPHVPGHELAGVVLETGKEIRNWRVGNRVTVPFSCGCGACAPCLSGQHQVCDNYFQPGFTAWGSFAEFVAIPAANVNVVGLPDSIDSVAAASLGCRFATSYRAVIDQGALRPEQWVAVHGCGGVGLVAIMIAAAVDGQVVAIDIDKAKLERARQFGAAKTILAAPGDDTSPEVRELTMGGADLSIDALGSTVTCANSVRSLRKQGRHVQIGLLLGSHKNPPVPMHEVIARELQVYGSHGMSAQDYGPMLEMIEQGRLAPAQLIGTRISLDEAPSHLSAMDQFRGIGITIIDRF